MAFKRKSKEELDAEVDALKATLDAAVQRLADSPEQWVEFLDVISQFGARYSWGNQLLILIQATERGFSPTMVRPYGCRDKATGKPRSGWAGGWLTLGRNVRKGETALKVWRPNLVRMSEAEYAAHLAKGGKSVRRDKNGKLPKVLKGYGIASVFDISQTEGDDVELPPAVTVTRKMRAPGGKRPELLTGDDETGALDEFISMIKGQGYSFEWAAKAALGGANGDTSGLFKAVRVRDDVDKAQAAKTAVHELAHILCGHVDDAFDYVAHRGQAETEAESVAYIVCGALGLDTERYSAPYVATWAEGNMDLVRASANKISKTARTILAAFDAEADGNDGDDTSD